MTVLTELMTYIASYLLIIIIGLLLMNFLTNGFITTFIRIKASRGKKIGVKVRAFGTHYFRVGEIDESSLRYKARKTMGENRKDKIKIINLPKNVDPTYKFLNITWVDVDENKNCVFYFQADKYESVVGFDAVRMQDMIVRAAKKPNTTDWEKDIKFLKLMSGLIILGIVIVIVVQVVTSKNAAMACQAINSVGGTNIPTV